ncbi:MAG TPA: NAD(P)/FAD-dependent oxidoreductase [Candidatus Wunengus sp. YC60]|uniref:NAD(P)/FAD-dependent oxidoreductase n=1 Tax=Candidatus Wunengus sp. YC60 TaxID=3367697 RepID=UPI0040285112
MHLKNGAKIAVIGGGPAGSFFAHLALTYAKQSGIKVSVTIFEKKHFDKKGAPGCNMSAGVLSEALLDKLSEQHIHLPPACIQQEIEGYFLQVPEYSIPLHYPYPPHKTRIVTVFRGSGPRFANCDITSSFDHFLLEHARKAGADIILHPVTSLEIPGNPNDLIKLTYGEGASKGEYTADLVVGACGVNSDTLSELNKMGFGYIPPKTIRTCIVDICPTKTVNDALYGNNIYVFSLGLKFIRFAAFIPKGAFLTICLVGKKDMDKAQLNTFLNQPKIQKMLPEGWDDSKKRCICFPSIPINHARHPYTNRLVVIGDAGISRTYKNGIDSAFTTAQLAAKTAIERGVSEKDFEEGYFRPAEKLLGRDNIYGGIILTANDIISRQKHVVSSHIKYMSEHPDTWETKWMNEVLWNTVTGNATYKDIFFKSIHPRLLLSLFPVTLYSFTKKSKTW